MKGGAGLRLRSLVVTDETIHDALSRSARIAFDSASLVGRIASPFFLKSFASNSGGCGPASRAKRFQYSSGTNFSISCSRSQTSFKATDWTRPALRPRRTLSHRSGLIL